MNDLYSRCLASYLGSDETPTMAPRFLSISLLWFCLALAALYVPQARADEQYGFWELYVGHYFEHPEEGCVYGFSIAPVPIRDWHAPQFEYYDWTYSNGLYVCTFQYPSNGEVRSFNSLLYAKPNCPTGSYFKTGAGASQCYSIGSEGLPRQDPSCSAFQGNPINILSGVKVQYEKDFTLGSQGYLELGRYYNSSNGKWTHTYSDHVFFTSTIIDVYLADGYVDHMRKVGDAWVSAAAYGTLQLDGDSWLYQSPEGAVYRFDTLGNLKTLSRRDGSVVQVAYIADDGEKKTLTLTSNDGGQATVVRDVLYQPVSIEAGNGSASFTYGEYSMLKAVNHTLNGTTTTRQYLYESQYGFKLLTGIVDEAGVRYATWDYDGLLRANSSEHAGGAGKTLIDYGQDGNVVKVTNPLGKVAVYHLTAINGIKRIASIDGEPTANCPASNSSYMYNSDGLVERKTDAKGAVTTYSYNDRGLETSRTEASGTPLARTVLTQWDATRFLPVRVEEPERVTIYSYDAQGREVSRQVIAR